MSETIWLIMTPEIQMYICNVPIPFSYNSTNALVKLFWYFFLNKVKY